MAHDVFICYSSRDKVLADSMCATLESRKIRCWIAPRDVPPGQSWPIAIVEAIGESRVFVLILSKGSNSSPQVIREVGEAMDKGVPAIPFRIDDVEPSKEMGYYIRGIHWLDAMTPPLEKHLQSLADTVQGLLSAQGVEKPPVEPHPSESNELAIVRKPAPRLGLPTCAVLLTALALMCGILALSGIGIYLARGKIFTLPAEVSTGASTRFSTIIIPSQKTLAPSPSLTEYSIPTDAPTVPTTPSISTETFTPSSRTWQNWKQVRSFPAPGSEPTGIVRAGDNLWVNVPCSNRIYRLDLEGNILSELGMPEPGCGPRDVGLAWDGTSLWGTWWNKVVQIDPKTGKALSEFNADMESCGIAWDGSSLWLVDRQGNLSVYDLKGQRLRRLAIPVYGVVTSIAWVDGELWMLNEFGDITRFGKDLLKVEVFSLSSACGISSFHQQKSFGMYWDEMNLWVADAVNNRIYQCAPGE